MTALRKVCLSWRSTLIRSQPIQKVAFRCLSVEGNAAFESRRKAAEEKYFREIDEKVKKQYSQKLHEKEVRDLLNIVGDMELSSAQIQELLEWKHKK